MLSLGASSADDDAAHNHDDTLLGHGSGRGRRRHSNASSIELDDGMHDALVRFMVAVINMRSEALRYGGRAAARAPCSTRS
jgi:hypothetical protein